MTSRPKSNTPNRKPERRRQIIKRVIITSIVLVAVFGVYELGRQYHYWGEPDELRAIKAESVASEKLLGLELLDSRQSGQGDLVSKTVSPSVTRTFRVDEYGLESTKERIIKYAEEEGWRHDPSYPDKNAWKAKMNTKDFNLTMIIRQALRYENAIEVTVF